MSVLTFLLKQAKTLFTNIVNTGYLLGITQVHYTKFFKLAESDRTRGHLFKICKPQSRKLVRHNLFNH